MAYDQLDESDLISVESSSDSVQHIDMRYTELSATLLGNTQHNEDKNEFHLVVFLILPDVVSIKDY